MFWKLWEVHFRRFPFFFELWEQHFSFNSSWDNVTCLWLSKQPNSNEILAAKSPQGQTCCTALLYDNVTHLTSHASGAWTESENSFQCRCWKDTVISQVRRPGRVHDQAIKEVTAHPARWQAETWNPPVHMSISQNYKDTRTASVHVITSFLYESSMNSLINMKVLDLCHLVSSYTLDKKTASHCY